MEEQIKEHEPAIELKRARNSLLNVSRLPPEILGGIFRWNVSRKTSYSRLEKRSHNFLLVCHHWYEVASRTPGLWGFWGDSLRDWRKRYLQHTTTPLDLVLYGGDPGWDTLDDNLRNALKARAARDTIRQIHLTGRDSELLNSILSSLASCEGIRSSSVESVVLKCDRSDELPTVSDFLAYYRFPKLQRLELRACTIRSWDFMTSKTSVLTTLILDIQPPSPTITSSQILSILRSNPSLRKITLDGCAVPDNGCDKSSRVPLAHLRKLTVTGRSQGALALLDQLDYSGNMDSLFLDLRDIAPGDISRIVGPYLRDYLRLRGRSKIGLRLDLPSKDTLKFRVKDASINDLSTNELARMHTFAEVLVQLDQTPPQGLLEEELLGLIAHVPQEEIVHIEIWNCQISMEAVSNQLPYLRAITFGHMPLYIVFPESSLDQDEIFPPLRYLRYINLDFTWVGHGDWGSLMAFLDHLASSGNKLEKLGVEVGPYPWVDPCVEEYLRGAVREFELKYDDF